MSKFVAVLAILTVSVGASAAILTQDLGSGARTTTVGGYSMTAFGADPSGVFAAVTSVPSPLPAGGSLGFNLAMSHRRIGSGWASWSGGYFGDVYYTGGPSAVTMTMAPGTAAFSFYIEPNPFSLQTFTATSGSTSVTYTAHGQSGAYGYGFYTDDASALSSIAITATTDFAVGEFSAAPVPEPATLSLLALGGLALIRRR